MNKIIKYEWKRYVISICVITLIILPQYISDLLMVFGEMSFARRGIELYSIDSIETFFATDFVGWLEKEFISLMVVLFFVMKAIFAIIERKNNNREFNRTLPVRSRTRKITYLCLDFFALSVPVVISQLVKWGLAQKTFAADEVTISWFTKMSFIKLGIMLLISVLVVSIYHLLDTVFIKKAGTVIVMLATIVVMIFVEFDFDLLLGLENNTELLSIENQYDTYQSKYQHEVEVEPDSYEITSVVVSYEDGYHGQFEPDIHIVYQGKMDRDIFLDQIEQASKDTQFDEETRAKNVSDITGSWLYYDMQLMKRQEYLNKPYTTTTSVMLAAVLIMNALSILLSGLQKEQASGIFYFESVKYVVGLLAGVMIFIVESVMGETPVILMCISAVIVMVLCVYILSSNRKKFGMNYKKI